MDALLFTAIATSMFFQSNSWTLGQEREVDAGVYMSIHSQNEGWRIWKIETEDGISCRAVKSAEGRPHPIPVGVGSAFHRGTPFIEISIYRDGTIPGQTERYSSTWKTTHYGDVRFQWRKIGARFFESPASTIETFSLPQVFDAREVDEERYEIRLESWRYPSISQGYSLESAIFNFSGLEWAEREVRSCNALIE